MLSSRFSGFVALVDVGITEWRISNLDVIFVNYLQLHSLMLALPNGGTASAGIVMTASPVALVDVGITEWRLYVPVDNSPTNLQVALVDVGITEWRDVVARIADGVSGGALVDVGITEWRFKAEREDGSWLCCTR